MALGMLRCLVAVHLAAVLVAAPSHAGAQEQEPEPSFLPDSDDEEPREKGVETHDGTMVRLTLGLGAASVSQGYSNVLGLEVDITGRGLTWSADLGAAVTDRLTIQGRIGQLWLLGPELRAQNAAPGSPKSQPLASGSTLTATLAGVGGTYNFMPINLYVTVIGGLSVIHLQLGDADDDDQELVRNGFGLNLDVGKEWWLASQLGLGIAVRFWWATGGGEFRGAKFDRTFLGLGVALSSTYQ